MSSHGVTEKVQNFYQMLLTDTEAALECFVAEDIVWENPLPEHIPFGGRYEGAGGLIEYLTLLAAEIEMAPLHFTEIIANDGKAAAVGVERDTQVKRTGKSYTMPFVHVLHFNEDGKVFYVREYNDTREMVEAFK